jgi:predicted nuclease with TOPRIM domain
MSQDYLRLRQIVFSGPKRSSDVSFFDGVNVICGASDTGKSFLAEAIDFMLGGSELREIPQRTPFGEIHLDLDDTNGGRWRFFRSTAGGHFRVINRQEDNDDAQVLKKDHAHDKTDNMSGFLLDKIGLLGRRILRSKKNGTTQSLSFRNLARLAIVQEGEIQQTGSPFWGGQYTLKTPELATIKLLLTGIDDSNVVEYATTEQDNSRQVELIDELLSDIQQDLIDIGEEQTDLQDQLQRLEKSIESQNEMLRVSQDQLDTLVEQRREAFDLRADIQDRLDEISDLLVRFDLLLDHYAVDVERLTAIEESGSIFAHVEQAQCPLCGALPDAQRHDADCEGDVEAIVQAASAEIEKIVRLRDELSATVDDIKAESASLKEQLESANERYQSLNSEIENTISPALLAERTSYVTFVEERSEVQRALDLYSRAKKLEDRKAALEQEGGDQSERGTVASGLPDSVAHEFSLKIASLLKAWDFPGECHVHFDKETTDFVIDGKPRGSRGKGLRAITHAAVSVGLLEFCQENGLPHPGFVVLDSPLLAYFKPEGDEDRKLQGTKLKEKFYSYLVEHHSKESQILIIENQHPPEEVQHDISMLVFTGNPSEGRQGFL